MISSSESDQESETESDEEENYCISCGNDWRDDSKKNQKNWVECDNCKTWTYTCCQPKDIYYDDDFFCCECAVDADICS